MSKQVDGVPNQALLFEKVAGSDLPLAINTFGSYKRMHMAAQVQIDSHDELAGRIAEMTRSLGCRWGSGISSKKASIF